MSSAKVRHSPVGLAGRQICFARSPLPDVWIYPASNARLHGRTTQIACALAGAPCLLTDTVACTVTDFGAAARGASNRIRIGALAGRARPRRHLAEPGSRARHAVALGINCGLWVRGLDFRCIANGDAIARHGWMHGWRRQQRQQWQRQRRRGSSS